nr:TPA_asm: hypothetical protein [Bos-associated insect adintovirus 2]
MAFLSTSLLIFAALANNTFILHHGIKNVDKSYVCFNDGNDPLEPNWIPLKSLAQDGLTVYKISNVPTINNRIVQYKIRLVFPNKSYGDSRWRMVLNESFIVNESTNQISNAAAELVRSTEVLLKIDSMSIFIVMVFMCIIICTSHLARSILKYCMDQLLQKTIGKKYTEISNCDSELVIQLNSSTEHSGNTVLIKQFLL